jgi:hypothetical protein
MDIIDRYVYAVVSKLPEKQRDDIEKEIRALIDDIMEKYPEEDSQESKVKKALLEIGDPDTLADNYMDRKRYLIGPNYFDKYILILKIVLPAIFFGISVAEGIGFAFSSESNITHMVSSYIASLVSALFQGFTFVTLSFAFAEYKGADFDKKSSYKKKWNPNDLPRIPHQKAVIPKAECIVGIIFSTIFFILLYFAPQIFSMYLKQPDKGLVIVPFFNIDTLSSYKNLILLMLVLSIAPEFIKLIYGKWNIKLAIACTALNIFSLILTVTIIFNPKLWNPNFNTELTRYFNLNNINTLSLGQLMNMLMAIFVFSYFIGIATSLYKGFKYDNSRN